MQVKNILQVATVELASSVELLRVALVGLDLERIRQEEDRDVEGLDLDGDGDAETRRERRAGRARRAAMSSFLTPRRWRTAGKTTERLKFSKSKFEANFKCFIGIRVFLQKRK
jgi:hypothetical protein